MSLTLNPDQLRVMSEICAAFGPGMRHVLTGYAGSGKTTLMQEFGREQRALRRSVVMTAPTHKAVAVLRRKMTEIGPDVPCRTLAALLSLKPEQHADRQVFKRKKDADPIAEQVVVIDECSMVGADLMHYIKRHLQNAFVLFVGDPAQLPPIGEAESPTFRTRSRSHLDTIVRQGAGNPVLHAAGIIRRSQGGPMDWTWCASHVVPPCGVYRPRDPDAWMRSAFSCDRFDADPDHARYLAWTNDRVAQVNARVRGWKYGETDTPFEAGERALCRAPLIHGDSIKVNTNEEVWVTAIKPGTHRFEIAQRREAAGWTAEVASWELKLLRDNEDTLEAHMVRDERGYKQICDQLADEAADCRIRWRDRQAFIDSLVRLHPIYAMTVHTSQGSTFRNVFIDVPDIRRRVESNALEAQQLLYVAATRPTDAMFLVGAP